MTRYLRTIGVAAAALAASAALIAMPALAQQNDRDLAGAPRSQQDYPPLFSGQDRDLDRDYDRDYDRNNDDRNNDRDYDRQRRPDFQYVQEQCSRAGIQEAWRRNYYSAQYEGGPRLDYGRNGWEMRGRMRLHDRRGYGYVNTVCDVRNRGGVQIEFLR
jgi:hypothetical protein